MNGRSWIFAVIGILAATGVLNGIVFYAAQSSKVPLFEASPYEKGVDFEEQIRADKRLTDLGWTFVPKIQNQSSEKSSGAVSVVALEIRDRNGNSVSGVKLTGKFIRMSGDQSDQTILFEEDPRTPGTYFGTDVKIQFRTGLWIVDIRCDGPTGPLWARKEVRVAS